MNFADFDDWFCEQFQYGTNYFEEKFGIRCFFLAKISLFIGIVAALMGYKYWLELSAFLRIGVSVGVCVSFVGGLYEVFCLERMFNRNSNCVNPKRINDIGTRLVSILLVIFLSAMYLYFGNQYLIYLAVYFFFLGIYCYLIACTPLPPGYKQAVPVPI